MPCKQQFRIRQLYDFADAYLRSWFTRLPAYQAFNAPASHNMDQEERQGNTAADDLFSRAVCRLRQPVESLFNWLIEKMDMQRTASVRSTKGMLIHVVAGIAAAFILSLF